ncbi:pikAII [Symbiodinium microadriaticum]|nr:pikAII [Symbiodinium microadriaticum]
MHPGAKAVEFRNRLSNELQGVKLPNTLIFDYPTAAAIRQVAPVPERQEEENKVGAPGISASQVEALVLEIASEVTGHGVDPQDMPEPLMDSGLDSLAAVEFRNRLSNELQGIKLPNTLIFDYPTVAAISNYAVAQLGPTTAALGPVSGGSFVASGAFASVMGLAASLPGRRDDGFWEDLVEKKDSVIEIPFTRWDLDVYYSADPDAPGKTYTKHGGFIEGAELFDPSCFALSAAEAATIDPQQRLLLEAAHTAFLASGKEREQLMGSDVGVFVGQCQYDWFVMVSVGDKFNPYTGTGISASISANRTSYIFGVKGPSLTCDTACSSSLVAADAALSSLRRGTAEGALAAGTNLILGTGPYISFSKAKMLSEDGRCFTFDASANGYARGEGVGAAFLAVLADGDGDVSARALLRGTAANQDGRSASLTAPNGPSQQAVIRRALSEAAASVGEVALIECHGTGTALGDPIEVDALKTVLGEASSVALGAAKTNIAHLEGSAGIAGFLKSVHMLEKKQVPANLHFQSLNPHIDLEDFQAVIPVELHELPSGNVVSGLSSFGFGGTNAHLTFGGSPGRESQRMTVSEPAANEGAITFRHASFPWRETAYRCLRRKITEGRDVHYECTIKSDIFKVCAEHVAFNEIVAVKTIVGKEGYLKDLAMTWPLVVPKNADEPTATTVFLRFCQMGDKFEMRSSRGDSTEMITHCEGRIGRGLAEPATINLEELRQMCTEEVDPKDVYAAIHKGGLWLGPRFQVCKQMQRMRTGPSGEGGDKHVLCRLEHSPESQPNQGFFMHPATLDGTIHVLGATMVGWDAPLKIFSGMGRVQAHVHRNFSRDEQYFVHLDLKTFSEQEQVFDSTVATSDGEVLFKGTDVAFRKVTPEQIKKAMESQMAEDDQKIYVQWSELKPSKSQEEDSEEEESEGRSLVLAAEDSKEGEVLSQLPGAELSGISDEALEALEEGGLSGLTRIISAIGLSSEDAASGLDHALRLMKALVKLPPGSDAPELWFLTRRAIAVQRSDIDAVPFHAGIWGLARALRAERPDLKVVCLDVADLDRLFQARFCKGFLFFVAVWGHSKGVQKSKASARVSVPVSWLRGPAPSRRSRCAEEPKRLCSFWARGSASFLL